MDNKCFGSERQISSFAALGELLAHPQKQPQLKKKHLQKHINKTKRKSYSQFPILQIHTKFLTDLRDSWIRAGKKCRA